VLSASARCRSPASLIDSHRSTGCMTDVVIYQMRDAGGARVLKTGLLPLFCLQVLSRLLIFLRLQLTAELSLQLSLDRAFFRRRNTELFNTTTSILVEPMIYQDRWIEIIRRYVVSVHSCRATLALSTWCFWMPSIPIFSCSCVAMWLGLLRT